MPIASEPHHSIPPARILVAEDHLDSQEALRILLEAVGFEVAVAGDGREAVEVALAFAPDLILMDMMMPGVDGFEATRRLRRIDATRQVPIIALTAMEGALGKALEAGASEFLAKPIDAGRLIAKISGWLRPQTV